MTKISEELQNFLPTCLCSIVCDYQGKILKLETYGLNWSGRDEQKADWLKYQNKYILNFSVVLINWAHIHPSKNDPIFACEELFLDYCDKNFLRYLFKQKTFPNLRKVYLASHPADWYVLDNPWINNGNIEVFLLDCYFDWFKERWWQILDNIKKISKQDYDDYLKSFETEEISMSEYMDCIPNL